MALIGMRDVRWGFGEPWLLDGISFQIEKGERVCLMGRNGVGKSSLFRLLTGDILPDGGEVWRQQGVTVAALEQEVPSAAEGTVFDVAARGLADAPGRGAAAEDGWALKARVESAVSRVGLDPEAPFADLSAGMKRRALFARALARDPDVLLLDEPTNHLDIASIVWMEDFLLRHVKTLVFITHDRDFLKALAGRIMELDRGALVSYDCDYETYLNRRQADLEAEEARNRVFDKKLSQEEAWIRKGIKARRTRNEGRVRALMQMREEFRNRRQKTGNARMRIQEAERSGRLVIEAADVRFSYGGAPVVRDFSGAIMRGDRVGIMGPNGAGKTTLLNILLKKTAPESGRVRLGANVQPACFDQLRAGLDEEKTVRENIGEGNDFIEFNGQRRHVVSYLQDFLFSPERCRTPVRVLSGGEKNRLMLARMFTSKANLLVLDEPTNDLDAETLELLEELFFEYDGTLLLVSHDRAFLNNVVTSTLVFEGDGRITEYAGGYDDWLLQRPAAGPDGAEEKKPAKKAAPRPRPKNGNKLTFKEKRELEALPQAIEALEAEQADLYARMSDPSLYKEDKAEITRIKDRLGEVEAAIEGAYARWEALEGLEK